MFRCSILGSFLMFSGKDLMALQSMISSLLREVRFPKHSGSDWIFLQSFNDSEWSELRYCMFICKLLSFGQSEMSSSSREVSSPNHSGVDIMSLQLNNNSARREVSCFMIFSGACSSGYPRISNSRRVVTSPNHCGSSGWPLSTRCSDWRVEKPRLILWNACQIATTLNS